MLSLNRQAIALISDHIDPEIEIGFEESCRQTTYVRHVGETLASLGWQVDIFTRRINVDAAMIVQHSPHCRTISLKAGSEAYIPRDRLLEYMPEFVRSFQVFQRTQSMNYPLIHTNDWLSAWVGLELRKTNGVQLVHTFHSLEKAGCQSNSSQVTNIRLMIERDIREKANSIIAANTYDMNINNLCLISKADARKKLKFADNQKIILYVGGFESSKGIETLIRAFAILREQNLKNLKLVIAEESLPHPLDDQERMRIEQMMDELGITEVTLFAGHVEHDNLPIYYAAADVCVIPSHYEAFGVVAIEAMAWGLPVVASDVGGLRFTIIPEETGLLVKPRDIQAFVDGIHRILLDELWVRKMRKKATLIAHQQFRWTEATIQLSELYRRLLAQSIMHDQAWNHKVLSISKSA